MQTVVTEAAAIWRLSQMWRRVAGQESTARVLKESRPLSTTPSVPVVNKKLDGKVAIITGGGSGFGETMAKLFADHGAHVVIADIADENGERVASEIGSQAHFRHCDVAEESDVAATVDFAMAKFGKLDVMCNNAGIITPSDHKFETLDLVSEYDQTNSIMVRGVLAGIKHASRVMIPAKQGVILNTASTASKRVGRMVPIVYNMAKKYVVGMTQVASGQLGQHGIRVNAISPHGVLTPLLMKHFQGLSREFVEQQLHEESALLGKICTEDDIAKGALFLCSDDSAYISGQNLVVDGGRNIHMPTFRTSADAQ